jgi:RimJ/RimL family protein N-acetyltransferase
MKLRNFDFYLTGGGIMIPGKRLNLWALEKADLVKNYSWANDPELVKLTGFNPLPRTSWAVEKWYESILTGTDSHVYAIKLPGEAYIGNVSIFNIDWISKNGEIGIFIGEREYRNKGFASEALKLTLQYYFEDMGFHRIYAKVLDYNKNAQKLFESCGFVKEGVDKEVFYTWGRYWDVVRYGVIGRDFLKQFPYEPLEENLDKIDREITEKP